MSTHIYYAVILSADSDEVEEFQFSIERLYEDPKYTFVMHLLYHHDIDIIKDMKVNDSVYFRPDNNPNSKAILKRIN